MPPRKPARRRADIPADVLADLQAGRCESLNLVEGLAIHQPTLLRAVDPDLPADALAEFPGEAGITRQMTWIGAFLYARWGRRGFDRLRKHPSDTVRGWAGYLLACDSGLSIADRLKRMRPLADDPHFGVREWAWIAVRPALAADLATAFATLQPWVSEESVNLRRFAVEVMRPRGVWCAHIDTLKQDPEPGRVLLEPLRADPARYVQDSVANWLNDAARTRPEWVRELCRRWRKESDHPATLRICTRACRNLAADGADRSG